MFNIINEVKFRKLLTRSLHQNSVPGTRPTGVCGGQYQGNVSHVGAGPEGIEISEPPGLVLEGEKPSSCVAVKEHKANLVHRRARRSVLRCNSPEPVMALGKRFVRVRRPSGMGLVEFRGGRSETDVPFIKFWLWVRAKFLLTIEVRTR